MVKSNKDIDGRSVSDFALQSAQQHVELNLPKEKRESHFLQLLRKELERSELIQQDQAGAYFQLFIPSHDSSSQPVAVKLIRKYTGINMAKRQLAGASTELISIDPLELQRFLWSSSDTVLLDSAGKSLNQLTDEEMTLLVSAYEHRLHEKFYQDFVLPTWFVTFTISHDVVSKEPLIPEYVYELTVDAQQYYFEEKTRLSEQGLLTQDGYEILLKKGQKVQAAVQNWIDFTAPLTGMKTEEFTLERLNSLKRFIDTLEDVYQQTGYYPDPSMDNSHSGNLRFMGDKAILLDTNSLRRDKVRKSGNTHYMIEKLKQFYSWRINSLQQNSLPSPLTEN